MWERGEWKWIMRCESQICSGVWRTCIMRGRRGDMMRGRQVQHYVKKEVDMWYANKTYCAVERNTSKEKQKSNEMQKRKIFFEELQNERWYIKMNMCVKVKSKTFKSHRWVEKGMKKWMTIWAKITSGAYEAARKHKQVFIRGKMQHKQCIRTCKMELCNGILKTNREQDVNNGAA